MDWWNKPRNISVVVDNDSWILPHAQQLVELCNKQGDYAKLCRTHDEIMHDGVAFYLGCVHVTPEDVLRKNHRNLVVHASDLPKGRGMSPWTWQILEGKNTIPVCLLEAEINVDEGNIVYKDTIDLEGHELVDEIREALGHKTFEQCKKFLNEEYPREGYAQKGAPTYYTKRSPKDSEIDVSQSIEQQFNLLRVVDNEKYPAFFDYAGHRYIIKLHKADEGEKS